MEERKLGTYYRHFKGNYYKVLGTALDSEDPNNECVIYQAGYDNNKVWSRTKVAFLEYIKRDRKVIPRFEEVSEEEFYTHANISATGKKHYNIFVSLPFTGAEDTLGERYKEALVYVAENIKPGCDYVHIVAQSNIDDLIVNKKSVPDADYPYFMGKDIEAVLKSDAILMCPGWENSKGCNIEHEAAKQFGKDIFYMQSTSKS